MVIEGLFLKNLEICSRIFMYERVIQSDKETKIKRYLEMFLRDLLIQNLIILRLQF